MPLWHAIVYFYNLYLVAMMIEYSFRNVNLNVCRPQSKWPLVLLLFALWLPCDSREAFSIENRAIVSSGDVHSDSSLNDRFFSGSIARDSTSNFDTHLSRGGLDGIRQQVPIGRYAMTRTTQEDTYHVPAAKTDEQKYGFCYELLNSYERDKSNNNLPIIFTTTIHFHEQKICKDVNIIRSILDEEKTIINKFFENDKSLKEKNSFNIEIITNDSISEFNLTIVTLIEQFVTRDYFLSKCNNNDNNIGSIKISVEKIKNELPEYYISNVEVTLKPLKEGGYSSPNK